MKFKVGDKARPNPDIFNSESTRAKVDDILIINSLWEDGYTVVIAARDKNYNEFWEEHELLPYEEPANETKEELKIELGLVNNSRIVEGFNEITKSQHYNQGQFEVIAVLKDWLSTEEYRGFLRGNIIKYQARYQQKGGVKDLEKCNYYNQKLIELEEEL